MSDQGQQEPRQEPTPEQESAPQQEVPPQEEAPAQQEAPPREEAPAQQEAPPTAQEEYEPPPRFYNEEEKTWLLLCHLSGLFLVGPLIVWLLKKDTVPVVAEQGKEAVNFQITVVIALVVSLLLMVVGVGWLLFGAALIIDLLFIILASVSANKGEAYRYPVALRLIK